jgi:hypothetical protein
MKLRDFEHRFEDTLKSNSLSYRVEFKVEYGAGLTFEHKTFHVKPRMEFDNPLIVTLTKIIRPGSVYAHRRAKTSASCFVVLPHKSKTESGLRNVWSWIKVICLPL